MNTFLKVALGFVLGVISTIGVLYIVSRNQNSEENQLREEIKLQALKNLKQTLDQSETVGNVQSFELTTKKGIVKLHTSISKDSVQLLMGRPQGTNVRKGYNGDVEETWKYRGTNHYVDEFTIEFTNGKLISVRQYKEH